MHLKLHLFPNPSIKTFVLGAQKNRFIEAVLLSTVPPTTYVLIEK